jgi:hypothetical protein
MAELVLHAVLEHTAEVEVTVDALDPLDVVLHAETELPP